MRPITSDYSRPVALSASTESQVYLLFALAMGLTVLGVFLGIQYAQILLGTGLHFVLLIVELALIFSASFWMNRSPLNYVLFALFPLSSGITVTPYLMAVLAGYANGGTILMNALGATATLSLGAALFARTTSRNLSVFSRGLLFALLGLIVLGIFQLFIPSLRGTTMELLLSGGGIVIFGGFLAVDIQRIQEMGRYGANPFMLALSLYLDIFNLFMSVLRFMVALSGDRR